MSSCLALDRSRIGSAQQQSEQQDDRTVEGEMAGGREHAVLKNIKAASLMCRDVHARGGHFGSRDASPLPTGASGVLAILSGGNVDAEVFERSIGHVPR